MIGKRVVYPVLDEGDKGYKLVSSEIVDVYTENIPNQVSKRIYIVMDDYGKLTRLRLDHVVRVGWTDEEIKEKFNIKEKA